MIRMFASSAANVLSSKSSWSMNNRGGGKKKIKKRKTRGFFRFNVKTRTDLPSETKSALNFFRQMAAKMAESWSMLFFFLSLFLLHSYPLYFFNGLWEERKFLDTIRHDSSLPLLSLIHSVLPSMQCHRRHFNSRHDALVFFRVRPTDYEMDVGRLMKYLKVWSHENPSVNDNSRNVNSISGDNWI